MIKKHKESNFFPSREVSFEQLLEFDVSFADPKEHLEDVVVRSILLEQAIAILSPEEQKDNPGIILSGKVRERSQHCTTYGKDYPATPAR